MLEQADMNRDIGAGSNAQTNSIGMHAVTARIYSRHHLWHGKLARMGRWHRVLAYLMRHGKFGAMFNQIYTRAFVPAGEGSELLLYPVLGPIFRRSPQLAPFPRYIEVEMTTVCNKKCIFCENIWWPPGEQVKRHLKFDEFKHIIDQFRGLRWINATGEGSAFLNPDYFRMLGLLKDRKVAVYLVDHLADLAEEDLQRLVDLEIDGVFVSMDGATKQTYEHIKVGCDFDNVVHNIKYLIKYKKEKKTPLPEVFFRYIITKDNVHEIPDFIKFINSIGGPEEFGPTSYIDFCGLLYFPEIMHMYIKDIPLDVIERVRNEDPRKLYVKFSHSVESQNPLLEQCLCWMEPYILMGGYVLPCCSVLMSNKRPFLRQKSFGNLFEQPMKEIWNSKRYKTFRKMVVDPHAPVPKLCVGCRGYNTEHRIRRYGIAEDI